MKRLLILGLAAVVGSVVLCAGSVSAQYPPALIQQPPNYGVGQETLLPPALNLLRNGGVVPIVTPTNTTVNGVTTTTNVVTPIIGVDPALNYFLGDVTETRRRELAVQQQGEILDLQQVRQAPVAGGPEEVDELLRPLRSTGHPVVFNNLGGYYNNSRVANRPLYQVQRPSYQAQPQAQPPRVR